MRVEQNRKARQHARTIEQRTLDAEARASSWLADGNAAAEAGKHADAERCWAKAQFWLDRYNLLAGRGSRPAPKR
jgi:hypothetical protein